MSHQTSPTSDESFRTLPDPAPDTPAEPLPFHERIIALDVLRGCALFGIFMVNMPFFALPLMQSFHDPALADGPVSERLARAFVSLFFEYKFISLFSLLFGIGFVVQTRRGSSSYASGFTFRYLRRLGILFLIGLVHALGLWFGDILLIYAVTGLILLPLVRCTPKVLTILAAVALSIGTFLGTGFTVLQYAGQQMNRDALARTYEEASAIVAAGEAPAGLSAMTRSQFDPGNPIWQDAETRAFRDGPFADAMAFRATNYAFAVVVALFHYGWHVLAMFLLGAALMKVDFFASHRADWHRRLVFFALPAGLLLEGIVTAHNWSGGQMTLTTALLLPVHEVGSILTMLGYVGVICLIAARPGASFITRPIATTGRMALTVYLAETIIATAIMYWWGFGRFGSLTRVEMIGLVIAIYACLVAASVVWLRCFRFGPMEWLWRTLTYMRPQPFIR